MAIEPLGSVMTVQAQGSATQKPAVQEKSAENYTAANVEPVEKLDKTTNVVENSQGKGSADASQQGNDKQASTEQIKKAVEQLNKSMAAHSEAIFGIHEDTNRVMIKIVDKDTKKVLKELPPEKTLDMIAKVWEMAGILIDEKR
ncbi:MAG: flagellar protein FlaG [Candidatus Gastranaerophilales bacterium]|nr:flagellar protein FlaG [Candidatus Gastranaerophilales bacterium]